MKYTNGRMKYKLKGTAMFLSWFLALIVSVIFGFGIVDLVLRRLFPYVEPHVAILSVVMSVITFVVMVIMLYDNGGTKNKR